MAESTNIDLTCQQVTALLIDYVTSELDPTITQALQEHLRNCRDCVAFLHTYRETIPHHLAPRQRDLGLLADETLVPFAERPEDVLIVVAGASGAGAHSLCLPTFGNTRAVTVAIPS